jgi:2-polyprenyl-6-methoxyphenol hydroxylase-like FAD-dependent oxidoreductase
MLMAKHTGHHAIVIGAGMGGLAAAAALAGHFERVTVLERDKLGTEPEARPGTPQARLLHGILTGGLDALGELFPGFQQDLAAAGAVPMRIALDNRVEMPGFDPFPQRDFGWTSCTMSRPLLEAVTRRRVRALPNVTLRDGCRVLELIAEQGAVTSVRYAAGDEVHTLRGDLVVDASARGALSLDVLKRMGLPQPEETKVGIDMTYVMATFARTDFAPDWKMAVTFPDGKTGRKAGYLFPIEGNRWMAGIGEPHTALPSDDIDNFLKLAQQLRTPTMYDTIKDAVPVDKVHRFLFTENCWRHYERLEGFPRGLLPIGDAICRFNPIYGQGVTMAVKEANILKSVLETRATLDTPLVGLERAYFDAIQPWLDGTWTISSLPDLAMPETRGERPPGLQEALRFRGGLLRLAARDAEVHRLYQSVQYLVVPRSALRDPELVRRVQAELADA